MSCSTSFWSSRVHPASRSIRGSSLDCSSRASCLLSTIMVLLSTRISACFIFCRSTSVTRSTYLKHKLNRDSCGHCDRDERCVDAPTGSGEAQYLGEAWIMNRCCIRREVRRPRRSCTSDSISLVCCRDCLWMTEGASWNWLIATTSVSSPISVTRCVRKASSWTSAKR